VTQLIVSEATAILPAIVARMDERAQYRFAEFFTAQIRNPHTRRAYAKAVAGFCTWLEERGLPSIAAATSIHVAAYIETLQRRRSAPTVKLHLAAIRSCFDWLTSGGVLPFNPAAAVRGPKHSVKKGKTPILAPEEARQLLDHIDASTLAGKRDRALIALMTYSFARISAATGLRVRDVLERQHRLWLQLREKGGKEHEMPCHHRLETYLREWLAASGLADQPNAYLFPSIARGTARGAQVLTDRPLRQDEAHPMIRRRAKAAGIEAKIGNHTFRGTGITAYLINGGTRERAQEMANHSSPRTTALYDRREDKVNQDDVQKIGI
jgi:site-specific recombinase XerD